MSAPPPQAKTDNETLNNMTADINLKISPAPFRFLICNRLTVHLLLKILSFLLYYETTPKKNFCVKLVVTAISD